MYTQNKTHRMKPAAKTGLIILGLIICIGGAIGFDKWQKSKKSGGISTTTSTTTGGLAVTNAPVPESKVILKIGGSSTVGDVLTPSLVKAFMEKSGYSDVQIISSAKDEKAVVGVLNGSKERIDIFSKGTGKGFKSLASNEVDICMASSQAPPESSFEEHPIGLDGVAIVVNKNSDRQSINYSDIKNVFSSADKIYRMDDNAGIIKVFKEMVMSGKEINPSAQKFAKSADLVTALSADPAGIGFVSYTLINSGNIKALPITIQSGMPGIVPNSLTIKSEKYPLCRRLYFYTNKSLNQLTSKIIEFAESKDGQQIVAQSGFVNLTINMNNNTENPLAMPNDPPEYKTLINSAKKISTEFRFALGKQSLDSRGIADILRLVQYMTAAENNGKKVILVGFTDNTGDNTKNMSLSIQRAKMVKTILEASGISVKSTLGFGSARPVRSNETDEDRANNRRVEIWLAD